MSEMRKIVIVAAFFGILLGATIFFLSPSVETGPRRIMLQNSGLPPAQPEAVVVHENQSMWPVVIGFVLGGALGFGTFLVARRRT